MGSTTGRVTVTAKRLLEDAVSKSGRRSSVQLPEEFARIQTAADRDTELSRLFAQGEVAMKLYLTLVMLTRKPPHELFRVVPDHYWAELLGYEELNDADPIPGSGTRRLKRAMKVLATEESDRPARIVRTLVSGRGAKIQVIHPSVPTRAPWLGIPISLWSRGWINVMSARALFVYLLLRLVLAGRPDNQGAHISKWDRDRFAMKEDTWQRGIKELEALRVVRSEMARVVLDRWSTDLRLRKVYYLNNEFVEEHDSPVAPVA
jgi:hypothetical protein